MLFIQTAPAEEFNLSSFQRKKVNMQTSITRLEKPLYLWLARAITLGIILASIGISVSWLPEILDKLKQEGFVRDVSWEPDQNGEAIINYVSPTAEQNGIAIGDRVLNYEDDTLGKLGTPVTLYIQRGSSPSRDVTFPRGGPANEIVFGGIQLGLPFDVSANLAFLFILIPTIVAGCAALIIYFSRSNDWMALLTAIVIAGLSVPIFPITNPVLSILQALIGILAFLWFILFPNGRLAPRWSWAILLFVLPSTLLSALTEIGLLTWNAQVSSLEQTFGLLSVIAGLAVIAIIYYRYRYVFSPVELQLCKWVIATLILGLLPIIITGLIYQSYWSAHRYEEAARVYFFNIFFGMVLVVLLVMGILFSIFRYRLYAVDRVATVEMQPQASRFSS
jgi:hypothetical protein